MAQKRASRAPSPDELPRIGNQLDRLTKVLALLLVKGESSNDKIRTLAAGGYGNNEIAELLGITANSVNVALHRLRKKKRKK